MRLLLPVILLLLGMGLGVGAGFFLQPSPEVAQTPEVTQAISPCGEPEGDPDSVLAAISAQNSVIPQSEREYAKLSNQFIVPVVAEGRVSALVLLSLSIEVSAGSKGLVAEYEPKLRDVFLQVLFNHANLGGFAGSFTSTTNMRDLRNALRLAAHEVMADRVIDVLIVDLVRQDT